MEKYQKQLNNKFTKLGNLNYDETVMNLCLEFIKEFGSMVNNWELKTTYDELVDIYFESLYYSFINDQKSLDDYHLVVLMIYQPFVYQCISINRTYKEFEDDNKKYLEIIHELFGTNSNSYHPKVKTFFDMVDGYLKQMPNLKNISAIQYFHYFIGYKFDKNFISIDKKDLPTNGTIIFINPFYKLEDIKLESYIYNTNLPQAGLEFLTPQFLKEFEPIQKIKINTDKHPYTLSKKLDESCNYIALKYNNDKYTLFGFESPLQLNKHDATRFLNGALTSHIPKSFMISHAANEYYSKLNNIITMTGIKKPKILEFKDISSAAFVNNYRSSCERILSQMKKKMNINEFKIFEIYLKCYPYTFNFDVNEFKVYVNEYFLVDE